MSDKRERVGAEGRGGGDITVSHHASEVEVEVSDGEVCDRVYLCDAFSPGAYLLENFVACVVQGVHLLGEGML